MFHDWTNFYVLTAAAAGTLIGLMFVVMSLAAGHEPRRISEGAPVFIAPIVFHLACVLVISILAQVPFLSSFCVGNFVLSVALFGFIYAALTTNRLFRSKWEEQPVTSDKWFYGLVPSAIYFCLGITAIAIWFAPVKAAYALGAVVMALLLLGIRNAWDLTITLVLLSSKKSRGANCYETQDPPNN